MIRVAGRFEDHGLVCGMAGPRIYDLNDCMHTRGPGGVTFRGAHFPLFDILELAFLFVLSEHDDT